MSRKKIKQPERSERAEVKSELSDDSIRNSPATRALRFLLGKELSSTADSNRTGLESQDSLSTTQSITQKPVTQLPVGNISNGTDLAELPDLADPPDLADLSISPEINLKIKIEDQLSSLGAGSAIAGSDSQLPNISISNHQLSQSNLIESQLPESQLSSSHPESIPIDSYQKEPQNTGYQTSKDNSTYSSKPENQAATNSINLNWRIIEHTRIPQVVFDEILPQLPPMAQIPYLHLLRLTLGFQRNSCHISLESWASRCNQSLASIKRQAAILQQRGLLKKEHVIYGGAARGSYFRPIIPGILNDTSHAASIATTNPKKLSQSRLSQSQLNPSQPRESYMKRDHEDHENKKDHHADEVMICYQELTGNQITRADLSAYSKIAYLGSELIIAHMRQIYERSVEPIGSFAYFTKAVQKAIATHQQTRAAQKRSLERIIEPIRQNRVGARATIADLIEEIKRACARDNVIYNNDLVNEILGL